MKRYFIAITRVLGRKMDPVYKWLAKTFLIKGAVLVPLGLVIASLYLHRLPTLSELVPWLALMTYMLAMSAGFRFYGQLIAKELDK